jgi:serine phosphatase RsbU (regulator of sigma subunit)
MKKKPKIAILFIIGLSLILITLSVSLTLVALNSVKDLGEYAIKIDSENNKEISSDLFLRLTYKTAKHYSNEVKLVSTLIEVFAEQVLDQLTDKNNLKNSDIINMNFTRFFDTDLRAYLSPQREFDMIYFGGEKKIPTESLEQTKLLSTLLPICKKIVNEHKHIKYIWVDTVDKVEFSYPKYLSHNNKIFDRKSLKGFYDYYVDSFPLRIRDENSILPVKLLTPTKTPFETDYISLSPFTAIYDNDGNLLAYVGISLNFQEIQKNLAEKQIYSDYRLIDEEEKDNLQETLLEEEKRISGFMFALDNKGAIVFFPKKYRKQFFLPEEQLLPMYDQPEKFIKLSNIKNNEMQKLARDINTKEIGVTNFVINKKKYIAAYAKIKKCNWTLGYITTQKSLLSPILKSKGKVADSEAKLSSKFIWISLIFLVISLISVLLFFRHYFLQPIDNIINGIKKMGKGNFDVNLKEGNTLEIAELSTTFNYLGKELRTYMNNLKNETAARQLIETEIKIAEDIQNSILPDSDKFPTGGYFKLAARLDAAKNISGDFYDFFYIGENKIAVLIGDVSGKGIPAAFFMATCKALIKNQCLLEYNDPGKVLKHVNRVLCMDNEAQMFATVCLVFYNIKNGSFSYSNAGHHPSVIVRNGEIITEKEKEYYYTALGIFKDSIYQSTSGEFRIGDTSVLYTDGAFEAVSPKGKEYSEERLQKMIIDNIKLNPAKLCNTIINDIEIFEEKKRYDDITVIVFRRLK